MKPKERKTKAVEEVLPIQDCVEETLSLNDFYFDDKEGKHFVKINTDQGVKTRVGNGFKTEPCDGCE